MPRQRKKIIIISIVLSFSIISAAILFQPSTTSEIEFQNDFKNFIKADVIMPTKSSRPGCDKTDSCYIPPVTTIKVRTTITWKNEDAAFHSVTSGYYENPNGIFDSGYLDPDESFSYRFEKEGNYDYFCTLHPWMKGKIIVTS